MQTKQSCLSLYFPYQLQIIINQQPYEPMVFSNSSIQSGADIIATKEISLTPGDYHIKTVLQAYEPDKFIQTSNLDSDQLKQIDIKQLPIHDFEQTFNIAANQIHLLQLK